MGESFRSTKFSKVAKVSKWLDSSNYPNDWKIVNAQCSKGGDTQYAKDGQRVKDSKYIDGWCLKEA
jgi:hypothetical protein